MTAAQIKANARNQLFRQIHGYSLTPFINRAIKEGAITEKEIDVLNEIGMKLEFLKIHQFDNSKKVGLNPHRRCNCCNGIARWKCIILDEEKFLCNKHKKEFEQDNKQNCEGKWLLTSIIPIDPHK